MEKNANYFVVGVFVSAAMLGIFLFLIWLASPHDEHKYDYYTVAFTDSVSGLEVGSDVTYKGVKVGKVAKLRLVPSNSELIEADIGVDKTTPVRAHTKATLDMQGITGLVRIELSTDNNDADPPARAAGEKYPVLQGKGSKLYQALEDLPDIAQKILSISTKLDKFLDDNTIASMKQTAQNIERMTRDLNGVLSQQNVDHVSHMLGNLSATSDKLPDMVDRLQKTAAQMDAAAASLNGIISRNKGNINQFAAQGLPQLTAVSHEAKGAATSLRSLADKLKDDPSRLLYQPSSNGVEIPK